METKYLIASIIYLLGGITVLFFTFICKSAGSILIVMPLSLIAMSFYSHIKFLTVKKI